MVTYLKSYMLNAHNALEGLDLEQFSASLGFMAVPSSRALKKITRRIQPALSHAEGTQSVDKTQQDCSPDVTRNSESDNELFYLKLKETSDEKLSEMTDQPAPLLQDFALSWTRWRFFGCQVVALS